MRIHPRLLGVVAGVLCLVPSTLRAQAVAERTPALTLAEARRLAQARSPLLAAARHAADGAASRVRQAGSWPNPTLAFDREKSSGDGGTNSQEIVSLAQTLALGPERRAQREAAEFAREAAAARLQQATAQLDHDVARAYADVLVTQRRAVLATAVADAFARAVQTSATRLAGGDVSGYQHRRMQLEAVRYAAARVQAGVARDSATGRLSSLLGLAGGSADTAATAPLLLADSLVPPPLTVTAEALIERALTQRADLLADSLEGRAAGAEVRRIAASRLPMPTLSGGYKQERQAGLSDRLRGFVVGVSVPIPLWDRQAGSLASAQADLARRGSERDALRRDAARDVRAAFDAHQALAAELAILAPQLGDAAAAARRSADTAYAEGEIGLLEWLDAVRAYHDAEVAFATLQSDYIARRAALERATGATLF